MLLALLQNRFIYKIQKKTIKNQDMALEDIKFLQAATYRLSFNDTS